MPTYEYVCDACQHAFEKFQSMSAPLVKKCPKCGKSKVRRLIGTGAGLIFKGSGFYITDYRDAGYQEKAKAESGESKPVGDTKSSDGKPADTKASSDSSSASTTATSSDTSTATAAKPEAKPASKSSAGTKKRSK